MALENNPVFIDVVIKDKLSFNASYNEMMNGAGSIDTGVSRREGIVASGTGSVNEFDNLMYVPYWFSHWPTKYTKEDVLKAQRAAQTVGEAVRNAISLTGETLGDPGEDRKAPLRGPSLRPLRLERLKGVGGAIVGNRVRLTDTD